MTRPRKIPESQNYRQVVRGYLRLHQLTVEGRDESPDADAVRDSLDRPWRALTDVERDRVQGLSADLFAVSESTPGQPLEMNRQAQQKLAEAFEANQRGEWDRALALLRRWSKYIAPDVLSYLRAGIWSDSGSPDVAAVFYQHAATLDSDNSNYAAIHLHTLALADPLRAREMAGQIIRQPTQHSPVLVIHAADVMFGATQEMGELEAKSVFRALIPALTSALPSVAPEENPSLHAMGLATLALCHETQGDTAAALDYYTRGLRLDPGATRSKVQDAR